MAIEPSMIPSVHLNNNHNLVAIILSYYYSLSMLIFSKELSLVTKTK